MRRGVGIIYEKGHSFEHAICIGIIDITDTA